MFRLDLPERVMSLMFYPFAGLIVFPAVLRTMATCLETL